MLAHLLMKKCILFSFRVFLIDWDHQLKTKNKVSLVISFLSTNQKPTKPNKKKRTEFSQKCVSFLLWHKKERIGASNASLMTSSSPFHSRSQIRQDNPLNLSISISGGKETNKDSLSNGEWTGNSSPFKSKVNQQPLRFKSWWWNQNDFRIVVLKDLIHTLYVSLWIKVLWKQASLRVTIPLTIQTYCDILLSVIEKFFVSRVVWECSPKFGVVKSIWS